MNLLQKTDLNKKVENYKNVLKLYIKRGKKIINLLQKADLNVKSRKLKIKEIIKNFESI